MNASKIVRSLITALVLGLGAASVPVAMAQQPFVLVPDGPGGGGNSAHRAVATTNLNVRSGPGPNNPVVHVLQRGEEVDILRCSNGWCLVESRGPTGWAARNYLRDIIQTGPAPRPPVVQPPRPPVVQPPVGQSSVCFFDQANFRGRSFCAWPGDSEANLGSWGDRIVSVRVNGRAAVDICQSRNFRNCTFFDRDVPSLNRWLANNVGSYRVLR